MRKSFCILLVVMCAAFAGLAACDRDLNEKREQQVMAVGFDLGNDDIEAPKAVATRGTALTTSNLQNFSVFASYSPTGVYNAATDLPNFMYRQRVALSSGAWNYTPLKYWPLRGSVSYFAYAPEGAGSFSSNTQPGLPKWTCNISSDVLAQQDLLVAQPLYNQTRTTSRVHFRFAHVLSAVGFQARLAASVSTGSVVSIQQISLTNLCSAGTYQSSWTLNESQKSSYSLTVANSCLNGQALTLTNVNPAVDNALLMLLPQSIGNDVQLTVTVRLVRNGVSTDYTSTRPLKEVLAAMVAAKRYTLNLTVGLSDLQINCQVLPWTAYTIDVPPFE